MRQALRAPAVQCLRRPRGALPPAALRGFASGGPAGLASGGPPGAPGAGGAQAPPAGEALLKTKKIGQLFSQIMSKKVKKVEQLNLKSDD